MSQLPCKALHIQQRSCCALNEPLLITGLRQQITRQIELVQSAQARNGLVVHRATVMAAECTTEREREKNSSPPWLLSPPGHRNESPGDQRNKVLSDNWEHKYTKEKLITIWTHVSEKQMLVLWTCLNQWQQKRERFEVMPLFFLSSHHNYQCCLLLCAFSSCWQLPTQILLFGSVGFYLHSSNILT